MINQTCFSPESQFWNKYGKTMNENLFRQTCEKQKPKRKILRRLLIRTPNRNSCYFTTAITSAHSHWGRCLWSPHLTIHRSLRTTRCIIPRSHHQRRWRRIFNIVTVGFHHYRHVNDTAFVTILVSQPVTQKVQMPLRSKSSHEIRHRNLRHYKKTWNYRLHVATDFAVAKYSDWVATVL